MGAPHTYSATRRRNVSPVSTMLRVVTRDVDCSGFADPPEDGQFVTAFGGNPYSKVFHHAAAASVTALDTEASTLAMVWASAQHSDRQVLGDTRVPTLMHNGVEVQCKLFNADDATALSTTYPVGKLVSVAAANVAVEGSANRLVLEPLAEDDYGWAVGYVTGTSSTANPVDGDYVQVYLYDKPRKHGVVLG